MIHDSLGTPARPLVAFAWPSENWCATVELERAGILGGRRPVLRWKNRGGGKSGLHGNTVPGNPRRGQPQGKCRRK